MVAAQDIEINRDCKDPDKLCVFFRLGNTDYTFDKDSLSSTVSNVSPIDLGLKLPSDSQSQED
jgi:hypothetical protein